MRDTVKNVTSARFPRNLYLPTVKFNRCETKYTIQYNPKDIIAIITYCVMQKRAIESCMREVARKEDNKYLDLNETGRNN